LVRHPQTTAAGLKSGSGSIRSGARVLEENGGSESHSGVHRPAARL